MNIKHSNYPSFERNLDLDFKRYPPKIKEELKISMLNLKYHVVKGDKEYPTQRQLDYAWNYLKKQGYIQEQKRIELHFRVEKYHYRATKNFYYKGKLYKNGQYIPKQR